MPKNILIFSDGTGQVGGIHPDQKLSNVYKMYRALRPGPESIIQPNHQIAFYDPGLGAGEIGGLTFKRVRNILEAAVGTGIDTNVIDCYERILRYYEPGDRIMLFGFSRGAYTVRALANVMNLCGVPSKMADGSPIPKFGKQLRTVATEAVIDVYNHGAGHPRNHKKFFTEREEKGKRFRAKYGSAPMEGGRDVQGNVQPDFIGVFDSVAALGTSSLTVLMRGLMVISIAILLLAFVQSFWFLTLPAFAFFLVVTFWCVKVRISQFKLFSPDPKKPLKLLNPFHWIKIVKNSHRATWKKINYDGWLDSDVGFARHALAIDEQRADFPRVIWGTDKEAKKNEGKSPAWLRQVWFAGCHSDIGGSYPEDESRLSDISLDWMIRELKDCFPDIQINENVLSRSPDPLGLQHEETYFINWGFLKRKWPVGPRKIYDAYELHPSVITRLKAEVVPQLDQMKPYRPKQLAKHPKANKYYKGKADTL